MNYSKREIHNGTQYTVTAEVIAVGLIRAQVFYKDVDYPVKCIEYQNNNLVTCAKAVWIEYQNQIKKAINAHNFKALNR